MKARWLLAIITATGLDADWGFTLCERLVERWKVKSIYFAVYTTTPYEPARIEIKFKTEAPVARLRQWIRSQACPPASLKLTAVTVQVKGPWSEAHARAYEAVREIRKTRPKQFGQFYDVVHWMANMLRMNRMEEAVYLGSAVLAQLQAIYASPGYKHPLEEEKKTSDETHPTKADRVRTHQRKHAHAEPRLCSRP